MTMMNRYLTVKVDMDESDGGLDAAGIRVYQEAVYRIHILESCAYLVRSAPASADIGVLMPHYRIVQGMMKLLLAERVHAQADKPKICEAARASMETMLADYRKRFSSYAPSGAEQYRNDIAKMIAAMLRAWAQYRDGMCAIVAPGGDSK